MAENIVELSESIKERIQSCIFARRGAIQYESIIEKNGWLTSREVMHLCDLYADYLGDWTATWEEFDKWRLEQTR